MKARDKIMKWLMLYVAMAFWCGMAYAAELPSSPADTCPILAYCNPPEAGIITGSVSGDYAIGTLLTFTDEANPGYYFSNWTNGFGEIVSVSKTYSFVVTYHCILFANFTTQPGIGSLVTNADGSQGVLFHVNAAGTEGWMVALDDASPSCQWGDNSDVLALHEMPFQLPMALEDQSGYLNTSILRNLQAHESGYVATLVDFDNGWYLPSVGQLRKLYSAMPFIEAAITDAGGTTLSDGDYWSSSEYSSGQAFSPAFALNNSPKGAGCRVRAIRNYVMAGNNVVVVASNNTNYGTVTGGGSYANGQTVTVTATPYAGYAFDYWSEDGMAVSYDAQYQFTFTRSRSLVAHFGLKGSVGSIIVNADGSKGVVFWQSPEGDEGLMMAFEDASDGCAWGVDPNALTLIDRPFQLPIALEDVSGNTNTRCILSYLDTLGGFAANVVDFEHGWYLPSVGELRKLYAALPQIEPVLLNAGGVMLTNDTYWSSTEYGDGQAATATFSMGNKNKGDAGRVRAIRHFSASGPNAIVVRANDATIGTVSGSGNYSSNQTVTVTATPNAGYAFNYWTENGMIVSFDAEYAFTFTRSRSLVANFVLENSVGSVITNADGSRGVVFWQSPDGDEFLMVALEDVSEGCTWGPNQDTPLENWPSETPELLNDMDGQSNTQILREWFENNPDYAACKTDFANGWYLPSAGQSRKLYAALPKVEPIIINAGGRLMTEDSYWSSTERTSGAAWSPSFAMASNNKGYSCRVRAIYGVKHVQMVTQTIALSQGTNWFSTCVDITLADLKTALVASLGTNATITIKSKDKNIKYQRGRWAGQLTEADWNLAKMYQIEASTSGELVLEGTPIDPTTLTLNIVEGTNWIAFPYTESTTVANFFAGFAINNDQVKSKDFNSKYNRGRWAGRLTTLEPGQGYWYISVDTNNRIFTFPSGAK
jgi:hypothetical protein